MAKYINRVTGAEIETSNELYGFHWEKVDEPKKTPAPKKAPKKEVKTNE